MRCMYSWYLMHITLVYNQDCVESIMFRDSLPSTLNDLKDHHPCPVLVGVSDLLQYINTVRSLPCFLLWKVTDKNEPTRQGCRGNEHQTTDQASSNYRSILPVCSSSFHHHLVCRIHPFIHLIHLFRTPRSRCSCPPRTF